MEQSVNGQVNIKALRFLRTCVHSQVADHRAEEEAGRDQDMEAIH
jgi:hypothetical protein